MKYKKIEYNVNQNSDWEKIRRIFHKEGYLYFKGCQSDFVNDMANSVGHGILRDATRRKETNKGINGGMSVDSYYPSVDLHSESSFSPSQPEIVGFYCSANNRRDGKTLICDGRKVWKRLSLELKKILLASEIEYELSIDIEIKKKKNYGLREWYIDRPGVKNCLIDYENKKIRINYKTSPVYLDPYSQEISFANHLLIEKYTEPQIISRRLKGISDEETEIIRKELKKESYDAASYIDWKEDDLIILKNKIFMHGRSYCESQDGRIISVIQRKGLSC